MPSVPAERSARVDVLGAIAGHRSRITPASARATRVGLRSQRRAPARRAGDREGLRSRLECPRSPPNPCSGTRPGAGLRLGYRLRGGLLGRFEGGSARSAPLAGV